MNSFNSNHPTELSYERARKALAESLAEKGISDIRVLEAILKTPRHFFVDGAFISRAYEDMSLPIGYKQTISQPYVVAKMTEILIKGNILEKKPLGTILEIGTGCGYQTAILSRFCRKVFSVERIKPLAERAEKNLEKVGIKNFFIRWTDGTLGWPTYKKFDAIICAAAIDKIPEKLKTQLEIGGKLICPCGNNKKQSLVLLEKKHKNEFVETVLESVLFVPMLEGKIIDS
ncbi:MAG: protein-L-isoaspartate O-methyltransferase [Flavobacteriaceae bacterium]|nr:protein-L-isoaspartate O-methyltransferase [Flavobacteriaceae bacterium]